MVIYYVPILIFTNTVLALANFNLFKILTTSDVTGLKFSGFGRAGPDPSGFRAGSGFLPSGFGFFFGLF